jgi:hypothetical protein
MDLKIYNLAFYVSMGAILFPITLLLRGFRRQPVQYKWLAILLLFSFLCDFTNELQYHLFRLPVNIIGNAYVVVSPLLLSGFFYACLKWKSLKTPLIIFNIISVVFTVTNFAFIQKGNINTYSFIGEKLLIMVLSIMYYYKVLRELPAEKIYATGLFWVISTLFIINSAKLVIYTFTHYLVAFKDNLLLLWTIHNTMSIIASLAIGISLLIYSKNGRVHQTNPSEL